MFKVSPSIVALFIAALKSLRVTQGIDKQINPI